MEEKKSSDTRVRNWRAVIYPGDSAPDNWRSILDDLHIRWIESPLHDKDINPDGEPKKPHIHLIFLFEGKKSFNQIKKITDSLNAPIPQPCDDVPGMVKYLAHLDNPEKHQYDKRDIIGHGVDVSDYLSQTKSDTIKCVAEMQEFIKDNCIVEFQDILDFAKDNRPDWYEALIFKCERIINSYIRSQRHRTSI